MRFFLPVRPILVPVLALLVAGASCSSGTKPTQPSAASGESAPRAGDSNAQVRLVVLLVIDQLPSWSFQDDARLLLTRQPRGGIGRLIEQGRYYPKAEIPYAATFTSPGHAMLGTGAVPSVTGIVANLWYRRDAGLAIGCVYDPDYPVLHIAPPGDATPGFVKGVSSVALKVDGIAEALHTATDRRGKAVAISIKDRAAAFVLGRRPDLAIWYDYDQVAMTTSRFYADELPSWLTALAAEHPIKPRLATVWTPLPDIDHAKLTAQPDAFEGEDGYYGLTNTFPHDLSKTTNPARALRAVPLGDDVVLEAAIAAIEGESLGADEFPDVLAVSLSAHDNAGHNWGQRSWERLDLFVRLDDKIGGLLDYLDQRVGADHYAVVFTGDHGVVRLAEHTRAAGKSAFRVGIVDIRKIANGAAQDVLGPGDWVTPSSIGGLYMSEAFAKLDAAQRDRALDAIVRAVSAMDGIELAARVEDIAGDCEKRAGLAAYLCRSTFPGVSGDIVYTASEGSVVMTTLGLGTAHGSSFPDDRIVPVIVRAPGWSPGVTDELISALRVAPTVTSLLGVPAPPAATQPALAP